MTTIAKAGPSQNQELRNQAKSPINGRDATTGGVIRDRKLELRMELGL